MCLRIHLGDEIRKQLNVQQRSVNWLADKIGCDQSNLRKKLEKPHFNIVMLYRISAVLNVDFFAHYSESLSDLKREKEKRYLKSARKKVKI